MLDYAIVAIGLACGFILIVGTIKRTPIVLIWSKLAIRIAGSCAIMWAILKIAQMNHLFANNTIPSRLLQSSKTFIGGMAVGILIVVFVAGGFKKTTN